MDTGNRNMNVSFEAQSASDIFKDPVMSDLNARADENIESIKRIHDLFMIILISLCFILGCIIVAIIWQCVCRRIIRRKKTRKEGFRTSQPKMDFPVESMKPMPRSRKSKKLRSLGLQN
ncbi:unnamed protein product [Moneuplotes crassus]|uniref:Uncharacterized protein n=1 Tax=Euplotes crassus TaxID=5936 RepID=A0AAD1XQM4_EUPCR|nr:unnamed protein product [Moneuplotes crassus]